MASREQKTILSPAQSIAPAVLSDTATGSVVDLLGFEAATAVVSTGAIVSAGDFTAKLQHGDLANGSDQADVAAADLVGAFGTILAAASVERVGYRGGKRYLRVVATKNGGTSIAASALIVRGEPHQAPV